MKLLQGENLTKKQFKEAFGSGTTIITRSGTPEAIVVPIPQRDDEEWTEEQYEQLMRVIRRWRDGVDKELDHSQIDSPLAEPGLVEVSIGLAGIATAIAALVPGLGGVSEGVRLTVALLSSVVAAVSAYSALWLLARCCHTAPTRSDDLGLTEIWALLSNPKIGPSWLLAVLSVLLFLLSIVLGILAATR